MFRLLQKAVVYRHLHVQISEVWGKKHQEASVEIIAILDFEGVLNFVYLL